MPEFKKVKKDFLLNSKIPWESSLEAWFSSLKTGDIVLLKGEMGAGKTTFVNEMLIRWEEKPGASPTYAFCHRYQTKSFIVKHWDLFRCQSEEDLESLGFWDQLQEPHLLVVEWPEILGSNWWPMDRNVYQLSLSINAQDKKNSRNLELVSLLLSS